MEYTSIMEGATLSPHYPMWKKYACTYSTVRRLSVKEKRKIFAIMRSQDCNHETILVHHGLNIGEFCCMHILHDYSRANSS